MSACQTRIEKDSMGEMSLPESALYGASTQRAVLNFPVSGWRFSRPFIRALGLLKWSAAQANHDLGLLDAERSALIVQAAEEVAEGKLDVRVRDGIVYVEITRGAARRDFPFPPGIRPSLIVTARSNDLARIEQMAAEGVAVVTVPDIRWGRVDIKSVALLPNVLAKQAAREQGVMRSEGKEYVVADGDIMLFRFNV